MAGPTRLELATSGVTGRRSNQTELRPRLGGFNYNIKGVELSRFLKGGRFNLLLDPCLRRDDGNGIGTVTTYFKGNDDFNLHFFEGGDAFLGRRMGAE